jgi:hypothetical protein
MLQQQWRCLFLNGKLELNQTQTLMWRLLLSLYRRGDILGLRATRWGRSQPGVKARHDTRLTWPKIGDATLYHGHIEWSINVLEHEPEPKESFYCLLSNVSKNASFRRRMNIVWRRYQHFRSGWWRPNRWWLVTRRRLNLGCMQHDDVLIKFYFGPRFLIKLVDYAS